MSDNLPQAPFAVLDSPYQNWREYNELPSVEDAGDFLSARTDFAEFLGAFAALAKKYRLLGIVGAFVLHRHFRLELVGRVLS
jgi:hypothetical protein